MSSRSKRTLALSMAALLCVGIPGALDDRVAVGAVPSPRTVEKVKVIDGKSLSIPELAEFEVSIRTPGQPLLPEVRAWLHENAPNHDGETEYDPDASFFGLRVSELEDSASLVDEEITTLADAARDVKTANEIGSFVAELPLAPLADNSEEGLVGWGLDTNTGANAWIVWNGPMPASIESQLQELVVGTIDIYESNFSLLEIRSVADDLHAQALASTDANFARSDIDVRTASIIVTTEVGPP